MTWKETLLEALEGIPEGEELSFTVEAGEEGNRTLGRLSCARLRELLVQGSQREDKNTFFRKLLLDEMPPVELDQRASKLKLKPSVFCCFLVETEGKREASLTAALRSLVEINRDYVIEVDTNRIAVIKDIRQWKNAEEADRFAGMICDTVSAELMVKLRVGYGTVAEGFEELARAFGEAKTALLVGKIFFAGRGVISYRRLGIGRLVKELPEPLCEMYLKEVFHGKEPKIDEETALAVERFLENSLNISETARQLYVHRNTLVYRLDRFEKETGLDVRKFEDAMSFKIALMVKAQLKYLRENRAE